MARSTGPRAVRDHRHHQHRIDIGPSSHRRADRRLRAPPRRPGRDLTAGVRRRCRRRGRRWHRRAGPDGLARFVRRTLPATGDRGTSDHGSVDGRGQRAGDHNGGRAHPQSYRRGCPGRVGRQPRRGPAAACVRRMSGHPGGGGAPPPPRDPARRPVDHRGPTHLRGTGVDRRTVGESAHRRRR